MRERLKSQPDQIICDYLTTPALVEESKRSFYNMIDINLSHVMMLYKQKILTKQDAKVLLQAIIDLRSKGVNTIELDPLKEDFYFNVEAYIIEKVGIEIGGKMHTARSRNDILSTITRLNVRDCVLPMLKKVLELRGLLLKLAEENKEVVVTGYTHMQPAQPISLGYYFLAIGQAIERDFARWISAYGRLNLSTLGSGAFAGTGFKIDRKYVADALGFDDPLENNMDAVVSRDYVLEYASNFAIFGSTISRFATDLYYWASDEFSIVEVEDSIATCSSIMPQKKNPITLEHLRAKPSHLVAAYVSIFTTLKGIAYGHCRDVGSETIHLFWEAANETDVILELVNLTLKKIKFKVEGLKKRADENFSTVTELADAIVNKEDLSFREAHEIVGHIVGECVEAGLTPQDIDSRMLKDASIAIVEKCIEWSDGYIKEVLDSRKSVNGKNNYGGPSAKQCDEMIGRQKESLLEDEGVYNKIFKSLETDKQKLLSEVHSMIE